MSESGQKEKQPNKAEKQSAFELAAEPEQLAHPLLQLQSVVGNQAVLRLLRAPAPAMPHTRRMLPAIQRLVMRQAQQAVPMSAALPQAGSDEIMQAAGDVPKELIELLKKREGWRQQVYLDTKGLPTVGLGHLLTAAEKARYKVGQSVPDAILEAWAQADTLNAYRASQAQAQQLKVSDAHFIVMLASVNFQLGDTWFTVHKKAWKYMLKHQWKNASKEVQQSAWYVQTPVRVKDFQAALLALPDGAAKENAEPALGKPAHTLAEFIDLVCALEKFYPDYGPLQVLTLMRQIYYGPAVWSKNSNKNWKDVFPSSTEMDDPRAVLGPVFQAIKSSQTVDGIDVGHVFVGLDAFVHPTEDVTLHKGPLSSTVKMPNIRFGTWGGDLGSAVAYSVFDDTELKESFDKHASSEDLIGDVDATAIAMGYVDMALTGKVDRNTPISRILELYYLNSGSKLSESKQNRYRDFVQSLGGKIDKSCKITNRDELVKTFAPEIEGFARMFLNKLDGVGGILRSRVPDLMAKAQKVHVRSQEILHIFLNWLEARLN